MSDLITVAMHHTEWAHELAWVIVKCLVSYALTCAGAAWRRQRSRRSLAARPVRQGTATTNPDNAPAPAPAPAAE
jgi:hypothetical protein